MQHLDDFRPLKSPELGRYAQRFLQKILAVADPVQKKAQLEKMVEALLEMSQTPPKQQEDMRAKIWLQLLAIADNPMDMPLPAQLAIVPTPSPQRLPYPKKQKEGKSYGAILGRFIQKAKQLEGQAQADYLRTLGAYMKLTQQQHFGDSISEEELAEDFRILCGGELQLPAEFNSDLLSEPTRKSNQGRNFYPQYKKNPHRRR